jgi:hypothetical protein
MKIGRRFEANDLVGVGPDALDTLGRRDGVPGAAVLPAGTPMDGRLLALVPHDDVCA